MERSYVHINRTAGTNDRYDDLLAKAKAHGSLRIIVGLRLDDWKPEGELPDDQAVAAQRRAITDLQKRLLSRMAPFGVSDVKLSTSVPQVAIRVDAAALEELYSHPDVMHLWEDTLLAPGQ